MKFAFLALWFLCLCAIAALALVPNLMATNEGADKMLHLTVFCILMLWPVMTFQKPSAIIAALIGLFSVGIGIELAQEFIPGRNQEVMDIVFNCAGILSGLTIGYLMRDSYQSLLPLARAHTHMKRAQKTA